MITLLKNVMILDADTYYAKKDVLLKNGRIHQIDEEITSDADQLYDLSGYTLMPAFIDSHVHISSRKGPSEKMLEGFASNGILTVRDLGLLNQGSLEEYIDWLNAHKDPQYCSVVTAGRYIDVPGGYGMGPDGMDWGIQVTTAQEVRNAVDYEATQGVAGIKTGISDGFTGPIRNRISEDLLRELSAASEEKGIWSSAHIGRCDDLYLAVSCGIKDSAHTPGDGEISDECISMMVSKGVSMITTVGNMSVPCRFLPKGYKNPEEYRKHQLQMLKNLKKFYDAGGIIGIGTDRQDRDGTGGDTRIPVWEIKQLLETGIPFSEVLRMFTENGAAICGLVDIGSVREGYWADLIAFKGKLSADFHELLDISLVIHQGTVIKNLNMQGEKKGD